MRRFVYLALAALIAAGATGCAGHVVPPHSGPPQIQHTTDPIAAKIMKIAEDAAREHGGADPKSVQYVRSTRAAANKLVSGDIVVDDPQVYVIQILGEFHGSHIGPRAPSDATVSPRPFTCITLIVDAHTLGELDLGTGSSETVDLASLGPVTIAL
jgi:hypothetical protein